MAEAEARHRSGMQNLTEFIGSEPCKKRKRRTSFTPQALEIVSSNCEKNTHPSGQEMTEIAEKLNYDREVVRVWFCNKRQALKNTIKRLKQPDLGPAATMDPLVDSLEELPKWITITRPRRIASGPRTFRTLQDRQFANYVLSVWSPQLCKWPWRKTKNLKNYLRIM